MAKMGRILYLWTTFVLLSTIVILYCPLLVVVGVYVSEAERADLLPQNRRVLQHPSSANCLTAQPNNFKLLLDSCNWDKGRADRAGVFSIVKSSPGGHLLRWSSGPDPKPPSLEGCLTLDRGDQGRQESSEEQDIFLGGCDPKSPLQNWSFLRANPEKPSDFFVQKFGEDKCLSGKSEEGEDPQVVPCNPEDPDQIWRLCENLVDVGKCNAGGIIEGIKY